MCRNVTDEVDFRKCRKVLFMIVFSIDSICSALTEHCLHVIYILICEQTLIRETMRPH